MRILRNLNINFMGFRRKAYIISSVLILASLLSIFIKGINWGIDFTGGTLLQIHTSRSNIEDIRKALKELGLESASVQNFGDRREFIIRYNEDIDAGKVLSSLRNVLKDEITLSRTEKVGPTIGNELRRQAIVIFVVAILLMLIYIWFRFDLYFGLGAILALIHDSIITLGAYSIAGFEFNTTTVAALLTVIGYSINDSIVVSDRIREYLASIEGLKVKFERLMEIFNKGINATLSRTVITSLTTLIVVIALMVLGGPVLMGFAFALLVGVIVGTYSSIFVVSALTLDLKRRALER